MKVKRLIEILKTVDQNVELSLEIHSIDTQIHPFDIAVSFKTNLFHRSCIPMGGYVTFKFGNDFLNTAKNLFDAEIENSLRQTNIIKNEETKMKTKAAKKPVKKVAKKSSGKKKK